MAKDKFIERKPHRSDHYQWMMHEVSVDYDYLKSFTNESSIGARLNPFKYNEELEIAKEELKVEFWKLIKKHSTPLQLNVVMMWVDGYTQMEIAKTLNLNQSSVTKSLYGNSVYKDGVKIKHGGLVRKFKKITSENEKIQEILQRIQELQEEEF